MRRYGSGADYIARNLIEAVLFGGLICFSLLMIFNYQGAKEIAFMFFRICFVYALFALFAEMLPKTVLILSLLFSIAILVYFCINQYQELTKTTPNTLNILNNILIVIYAIFVSLVNTHLLMKYFSKSKSLELN